MPIEFRKCKVKFRLIDELDGQDDELLYFPLADQMLLNDAEFKEKMGEQIEIYVRNCGGKTLLNFYVPKAMRERFIKGLEEGQLEVRQIPTHLELMPLPEWITDEETRERVKGESLHVRLPIHTLNVDYSE